MKTKSNTKFYILILLLGIVFLSSCNSSKADKKELSSIALIETPNLVDTIILGSGVFNKELVGNGKLRALNKSILQFNSSEEIAEIFQKNGERVKAGQEIARLNDFQLRQRLSQAILQREKSWLDLWDLLLGQGFDVRDSLRVPKETMRISKVRSGYSAADAEYRSAMFQIESTVLKAPYDGVIANLQRKVFEKAKAGEEFCTVIDDKVFDVEFSVLESEMRRISIGDEVRITPLSSDRNFNGRLTEINPVVDQSGMIKVKASVINNGELLEGMNVKVLLSRPVSDQLVVPKQAVVLRDNYQVLFKCSHDSIAYWTYVITTEENSRFYSVKANADKGATLSAGDTIIVSGNLNLAHESKVTVK